jgi:hypothetical protein
MANEHRGRGTNRHDGGDDGQRSDNNVVQFYPVVMPAGGHVASRLSGTPRMDKRRPVRGALA